MTSINETLLRIARDIEAAGETKVAARKWRVFPNGQTSARIGSVVDQYLFNIAWDTVGLFIDYATRGTEVQGKPGGVGGKYRDMEAWGNIVNNDRRLSCTVSISRKAIMIEAKATIEEVDEEGWKEWVTAKKIKNKWALDSVKASDVASWAAYELAPYLKGEER